MPPLRSSTTPTPPLEQAAPSSRSSGQPGASVPARPPPMAGTATTGTLILGEVRDTRGVAQQAVNLLEALAAPREGEGEDRLQELVDAVGLVLGEVRALREEVAALRASLPVRRVPI